jgi:hypothetical protein
MKARRYRRASPFPGVLREVDIAPHLEPVVNAEKLAELLAEQAEHPTLDYKETLDLATHDGKLELVKDMAAMMMLGGYIVVGVDNGGQPTGMLTEPAGKLFDQARLQDLIERYIGGGVILSAVHAGSNGPIVLIHIAPHKDGFAVFEKDGQKSDGATFVFKEGDVFARHGTRSERWEQADLASVRKRLTDSLQDEWRKMIEPDLLRMARAGIDAQALAKAPLGTFGWHLSDDSFEQGLAELLRAGDGISLRYVLDQMQRDALTRARDSDPAVALSELRTILDRLACFAATVLHFGFRDWFEEAVRTFLAIYDSALDSQRNWRQAGASGITPERLWLEVIIRIEALGGLVVRKGDWVAVRTLAMQASKDRDTYNSWVRHGLTQAARANLFDEPQGNKTVRRHLIQFAHGLADGEACLRPDLPEGDEAILDSILQFDMLTVLMTVLGSEPEEGRAWYPNFAFWYTGRTEPIVRRFLTEPAIMNALLPGGVTDQQIAAELREIDGTSRKEAWAYAGWRGFGDPVILKFLEQNTPETEHPGP